MKAAIVHTSGKPLVIEEIPRPEVSPGKILVNIKTSGVGAGVHLVKEGERVGIPWLHTACGACEFCLLTDQMQFHVRKYLLGLAKEIERVSEKLDNLYVITGFAG